MLPLLFAAPAAAEGTAWALGALAALLAGTTVHQANKANEEKEAKKRYQAKHEQAEKENYELRGELTKKERALNKLYLAKEECEKKILDLQRRLKLVAENNVALQEELDRRIEEANNELLDILRKIASFK